MLNVTGNEDASQIRVGHLPLSLLHRDTTRKDSVATKHFPAALDQDYLAALLADATAVN